MYVRETKVERHFSERINQIPDAMETKYVAPGRRGVPDRILCYQGHTFFVELKAPKGKLAVAQRRDHELRRRCGIQVYVLHTIEAVDAFVDSLSLL